LPLFLYQNLIICLPVDLQRRRWVFATEVY